MRSRTTARGERLSNALRLLPRWQIGSDQAIPSAKVVREFVRLQSGAFEHEVLVLLLLGAQNRPIDYRQTFRDTVTQTSAYPGEVVTEALPRKCHRCDP